MARSVAAGLLRLCGCAPVAEAIADLHEEQALRRRQGHAAWRVAAWTLGQAVGVCVYDLRDRVWSRTRAAGRADAAGARIDGSPGVPGFEEAGVRGGPRGGGLHPDVALRLALRSIRAGPAVPLAAAVTLAIGFGAAGAILGVYSGFDRPLPVPEGDRVVRVDLVDPVSGQAGLGAADVEAWRDAQESLADLGAFTTRPIVVTDRDGLPVSLSGAAVGPGVFDVLRVRPLLGSLPTGDGRPAGARPAADAVVLAHDAWRRLFDGDPEILGRGVRVDGTPMTVAAVMPEGIRFPFQQQVWVPLEPVLSGVSAGLSVVGRLEDGVSAESAALELQETLRSARRDRGEAATVRVRVLGFTEERGEGGEKVALLALLILVVALLLVSCSNVSNLLLGRAIVRSRALALHAALGAAPGQVALQMLAEAAVVAFGGAVMGLGLAGLATRYIEQTLSGHWGYHWMRVGMGLDVVLFTLGLAVVVALVSGMLPALRSRNVDLAAPLQGEAPTAVGGGTRRVAGFLVASQVALSSAALVVAALMASGLLRSRAVADGFPADRVQVASVSLERGRYDDPARRREFRQALMRSLSRRGLGDRVALASGVPGLNAAYGQLEVEGRPRPPEARAPGVAVFAVRGPFFELLDIRLRRGRTFHAADGPDAEPVAVVSRDFVARHLSGLAGADDLGRRIRIGGVTGERWVRIVGVVDDVLIYDTQRDRPMDWVYLPMSQVETAATYVLMRPGEATALTGAELRAAVAGLDPDLPVAGVLGTDGLAPLSEALAYVRRIFETTGTLAALGGLAALFVAILGLYAILAFEVGRRRAEIGVRVALGAARRRVVLGIVRRGVRRVLPGLVVGLGLAWVAGPLFGVFLMGAEPRSPVVFGLVALGYVLAALLATVGPARRAAAMDPAGVLRGG